MGDGKCDLECNNFQCIWDGFDCGSDCAYNCKINMIGNSICDQECNNSECEWDGSDCFNRKLLSCDCSNVTIDSPLMIFVSNNTNTNHFNSLNEAIIYGACCMYNTIYIITDTTLNDSLGSSLLPNGFDVKTLNIIGQNERITITINGQVNTKVEGIVSFSNLEVYCSKVFESYDFMFDIKNNGTLNFKNVVFTNYLNNLAFIDEGTVEISDTQISGTMVNPSLITTSDCERFCKLKISNSIIKNSDFQGFSMIKGTNLQLFITNTTVLGISSVSTLISLTTSQVFLESLNIKNSSLGQFMNIINFSKLEIINNQYTSITFVNFMIQIKYSLNIQISNLKLENINNTNNDPVFLFQACYAEFSNTNFYNINATAILSEYASNLQIKTSTFQTKLTQLQNPEYNDTIFTKAIISGYSFLSIFDSSFIGIVSSTNGAGISMIGGIED